MSQSDKPLELRFPKRLEKVRQIGVEIARSVGEFSEYGVVSGGRVLSAPLDDFPGEKI